MENGTVVLGKSLATPQKVKYRFIIWLKIQLPGTYQGKIKTCSHKNLHTNVFRAALLIRANEKKYTEDTPTMKAWICGMQFNITHKKK